MLGSRDIVLNDRPCCEKRKDSCSLPAGMTANGGERSFAVTSPSALLPRKNGDRCPCWWSSWLPCAVARTATGSVHARNATAAKAAPKSDSVSAISPLYCSDRVRVHCRKVDVHARQAWAPVDHSVGNLLPPFSGTKSTRYLRLLDHRYLVISSTILGTVVARYGTCTRWYNLLFRIKYLLFK